MPLTVAPAPSAQDKTAPVAPVSEVEAARIRVAPLLAQFEATYGRPLAVAGPAAEAAAVTVRSVAALQRRRR